MFDTSVTGSVEIRHVQGLLIRAELELERKLVPKVRDAAKSTTIKKEVQAEAVVRLPSGYAELLARTTRVETRVTSGWGGVRAKVKVSARGRRENRDVRRLNQGILRHPLFGNRYRWYNTSFTPGYVDDPIDALGRRVADAAQEAADEVADKIVRG